MYYDDEIVDDEIDMVVNLYHEEWANGGESFFWDYFEDGEHECEHSDDEDHGDHGWIEIFANHDVDEAGNVHQSFDIHDSEHHNNHWSNIHVTANLFWFVNCESFEENG